jgi:hypothetical protein
MVPLTQTGPGAGAPLIQPAGKVIAIGYAEDNATGRVYVAMARYLTS